MDIAGKNRIRIIKKRFFFFFFFLRALIFQDVPHAVLVLFGLFKDFTNARRNIKKHIFTFIQTIKVDGSKCTRERKTENNNNCNRKLQITDKNNFQLFFPFPSRNNKNFDCGIHTYIYILKKKKHLYHFNFFSSLFSATYTPKVGYIILVKKKNYIYIYIYIKNKLNSNNNHNHV